MIDWVRTLLFGKSIAVFEYTEIDGRQDLFALSYYGQFDEVRLTRAVKYMLFKQEGIQLKSIRVVAHAKLGK